jgi:gamma-glutamylcyclotransferase (GGCT)/AIG2-like uncharacterized protein YtfP
MYSKYLFVYGSLLTGVGHAAVDWVLRRRAHRVGRAYVHGCLYDLGPYPAALPSPDPHDRVYGEVYLLRSPRENLRLLDRYEDYRPYRPWASEFLRLEITAHVLPNRQTLASWIYLYNKPVHFRTRIWDGDYRAFRRRAPGFGHARDGDLFLT